jgi:peptidyl-dipeptidase Dcp
MATIAGNRARDLRQHFEAMERPGSCSPGAEGVQRPADADTSEALQAVRSAVAPQPLLHRDAIYLDPQLFHPGRAIHQRRDALGLDAAARRLVERVYRDSCAPAPGSPRPRRTPCAP